ncbi:hypothetical protein V2J09_014873 [Rumex salicifolius]
MNSRYILLLDSCKSLKQFKQVHTQITASLHLSTEQLSFSLSRLASLCALTPPFGDSLAYAKTIFYHLPNQPISLWNNLIRGLSLSDTPLEAIELYQKLIVSDQRPNSFTYPCLLKACAKLPLSEYGVMLHTHAVKFGVELDSHVQSSLIHFYASTKDLDCAKRVFESCCFYDVVSWNSMIDGCVKCEDLVFARLVFDKMVSRDVISWNTMINGYGILGQVEEARKVFDEMPVRNHVSWNSMLSAYAKCGKLDKGKDLFDRMPYKDLTSWNAMLTCYVECGKSNKALALFEKMLDIGIQPTEVTFVILLSACAQLGSLDQGLRVHQYIKQHKTEVNPIMNTALVDMYARCGDISKALEIFSYMESKDTFAWNTIIVGMAIHGRGKEALQLFEEMKQQGFQPNDLTFVALLVACSHSGMVEEGQNILHCMAKNHGLHPKTEHYGCITDLLARSGCLEEAAKLVASLPVEPNATIWGALVGGCRIYANNAVGERAGKHLIDLQPRYSGRYTQLSNIYASVERWEDASKARLLVKDKGVKKFTGLSVIKHKGFDHSIVDS